MEREPWRIFSKTTKTRLLVPLLRRILHSVAAAFHVKSKDNIDVVVVVVFVDDDTHDGVGFEIFHFCVPKYNGYTSTHWLDTD